MVFRIAISKILVAVIIIVVIVAVVAAYLSLPKSRNVQVNVSIPQGAKNQPQNWNNSILVSSSYFNPPIITVVIGINNTVIWKNDDSTAHTIYYVSVPSGVTTFGNVTLQPAATYSYTFTVPGIYSYYCYIHPWMGGIVKVISSSSPSAGY